MEDAARVYNRRLTAVAEATDTGDAEPAPYGPGGQYEIIDPERLALPKGGAAGSVKLLDCLPEAWQRTYEDINNILQRCDAEAGAWMRRGRVSHGCASDAAYARLSIRRMIEYSEEAPPVVNGCFAVPKKDPGVVEPSERRQRFIGNMVPCNRRFLKPPTCYLPNLGEVAELSVGAPCYSGKTDLDTYYYRFEVPESWRPYFSLPPVWSDERGLSYPMHLMGVRTVRGDGMDRLELVESAASAAWRLLPEDPPHPAQLVMIDDLGVTHGRSAEETNAVLTKACEESYGPKGLVVNEKKVERAEEGRPVEILGIEFCQDGSMRPSAARMAALGPSRYARWLLNGSGMTEHV
eukprot:jgi/Mesvir1/15647/Mv03251-RA.1